MGRWVVSGVNLPRFLFRDADPAVRDGAGAVNGIRQHIIAGYPPRDQWFQERVSKLRALLLDGSTDFVELAGSMNDYGYIHEEQVVVSLMADKDPAARAAAREVYNICHNIRCARSNPNCPRSDNESDSDSSDDSNNNTQT